MQNTGQALFHLSATALRRCRQAMTAFLCCATVLSGAQASTNTPDNGLEAQTRQWMSTRLGVPAEQIQVFALDPRVRTRPCQSPWQLDQPFAQQIDTVRARCSQPQWQVFVRLGLPNAAAAPSPAMTVTAAAPRAPAAPAVELRSVVVASGLLQRGTRIQPDQVEIAERDARTLGGVVVERIEDVLHAELVRDIPAGSVLRGSDIRPAWLVRKGQLVQLSWSPTPGFQISARVEAMENGRMGEPVRLKNRDSGRIISGVVTGLGTVAGL